MTNEQRELVERLRNRHLLGDCQEAATTIEQLVERCGRLEAALNDAIECVESWAAYASPYFQEKHDFAGDLKRLRDVLFSGKTEGDAP